MVSQSVVKASHQNTLSSFSDLLLKLLHFSQGVCAARLSVQAAILLCTWALAPQMPSEAIYPEEVMAAVRAEYYTENRMD